ncbi:GNAT family N-acetyltransferase [Microbacterium sp. 22242]|uniref:GNAT family N-acetyltransferase n=1 Tax=Microbacterium sp. 22242 TaxID=3453896 RepID=UPI003F85D291
MSKLLSDGTIVLSPIEREDLRFLKDLADDPAVRENVVGWDWPLSMSAQERWFERGIESDHARRFVIRRMDGTNVGLTGLWDIDARNRTAMSAIKIGGAPDLRGKGYGRRALQMTMDFAFLDVGLHRLTAQILEFNSASLALYRDALGWSLEGISRQHVWRHGKYCDVLHFGMLRDEYIARGDAE